MASQENTPSSISTGIGTEPRLVATVMKSIALVQSGLVSVLLEPKGATQEARFSLIAAFCRRDQSLSY
jgi:hypothetical protein